jgi:sulfur carrier protein
MSVGVRLNGEPRALPPGSTVADAVAALTGSGPVAGLAVAVNEQVVPRSAWVERALADGDRVEVLTAVQGG